MKSSISGPAGTAIIVIVLIIACVVGYLYLRGPGHASLQDNLSHERNAMNYRPSSGTVNSTADKTKATQGGAATTH